MLPEQKLDALLARHQAVEAELASQLDAARPMSSCRASSPSSAPWSTPSRPIAAVAAELAGARER